MPLTKYGPNDHGTSRLQQRKIDESSIQPEETSQPEYSKLANAHERHAALGRQNEEHPDRAYHGLPGF